jgi:ribosomal protein L11 methyltransferase
MKHHKWYQITIQINESHQDLLIGRLTYLSFNGFSQEEQFLKCYIPTTLWTRIIQNDFQSLLKSFKLEYPSLNLNYSISLISDKNWNKAWEKQTGIVDATSNIIIKPSWRKLTNRHRNKLILQIDPKMSFGTGHHETTRLSLTLLERFIKPNMRVLDFGCGTGVLGIASVKLGARSVVAIDNDEWAIRNTYENMKRNRVGHKMHARLGNIEIINGSKFDLIMANIDYPTITRFISSIASKTCKNGTVIISGILTSDIHSLLPLFKKNYLIPVEIENENEWVASALCRV